MKILHASLAVLFVLGLSLSAQSATVLKLTFDSAPVVDDATYDFISYDIPNSGIVSNEFNKPLGSQRDYGWTWTGGGTDFPAGYNNTGNYPDIVTPATTGIQGGNALFTALGTAGDPTDHIGWYINEDNGISVTGDFTAEAVFMTNVIEPVGSEYGLQNIFGNDSIVDASRGLAAWKFRIWPAGGTGIGGSGQLQLWTGNTVTFFGEKDVDGPTVTPNAWHHVACAYTASTNTLELFYDGVSRGTTQPDWGDTNQTNWWVGDWPPNPAPRGFAGWIDAVALSDTVLAPGSFVIESFSVNTWAEY